jgi:hypothetical protein
MLAMVACGVGISLVPDAVRAAGRETLALDALNDRPRLDDGLSAVGRHLTVRSPADGACMVGHSVMLGLSP